MGYIPKTPYYIYAENGIYTENHPIPIYTEKVPPIYTEICLEIPVYDLGPLFAKIQKSAA